MQRLHEFCTVDGCERKHKARGYCATHYMMWKRGAEITSIKSRDRIKPDCCIEEGCTEPVKSKGLCKMHYQRLLRHGHTKYRDRKKEPKICIIPNCDNHSYSKQLCNSHYMKQRTWKKMGFGVFEYLDMHKEQGGVCKICGRPEFMRHGSSGKVKDLAIDHCHQTNVIRGLLCSACNTSLGLLKDNVETLKSAIKYLEESSKRIQVKNLHRVF